MGRSISPVYFLRPACRAERPAAGRKAKKSRECRLSIPDGESLPGLIVIFLRLIPDCK